MVFLLVVKLKKGDILKIKSNFKVFVSRLDFYNAVKASVCTEYLDRVLAFVVFHTFVLT